MRGSHKRQKVGKLVLSVGLAALLVFTFTLVGGLGLAGAAPNLDPGVNNGNGGVGNGNGNGNKATSVVADPGTGSGTTLVPTTFGGNAHLTTFTTESTTETVSGHAVGVFTRKQNGEPTRVCVQHVANGNTVVENFMPFNGGHGSDVFVDVATSTLNIRIKGNEQWQLCAPEVQTPTTTTTTTTTTATTTTTTGSTAVTTVTTGETVAGTAVTVGTAAVTVTPAVVTVPAAVIVTQAVAAATALPRAGGSPVLPSALAGLGLLFSAGGMLLRRFTH